MQNTFETQNLPYLKELLSVDTMGRMSDMNQIFPQFVMSAHLEEDFKPFLDEIMKKTVLNGDQVPMDQAKTERANRNKLIGLYRTFFFGDPVSDLEFAIEREYVGYKMDKESRYLQTQVNFTQKRILSIAQSSLNPIKEEEPVSEIQLLKI